MEIKKNVKNFTEFDDYYIDGNGLVRSKNSDFHIFRFNELGNSVVTKQGPFKTAYYQFALGTSLNSNISIYDKYFITEEYSMVIFVPGQIIQWERTGDWDGYVINVKESFINRALIENHVESYRYLQDMRPLIFSMQSEEYQGLSHIYEMMLIEHQNLLTENLVVIKNLMNVLLIHINRILSSKSNYRLKENSFSYLKSHDIAFNFKSLVLKNYLKNKSVQFYANTLGISPNTLNKRIKEVYSKSPKEFINEVLLLHAKTILKDPKSSVKEVGFNLNFDDYSHFMKFFKKMTGITPAEFKNTNS